MPETRARDLANLAGAGATSSTVAYHETSRAFTLPAGAGEANQVISSDGDGTTQWKTTLSAPEITSVTSDKGVNAYDSDGDDGAVIVVNGTNLGSDASALTVEISTDNFVTTVQTSTISILSTGTQIQATFDGTETNYNTINAGETVKVKVTKSNLQSAQSATLSGTVTGDPTFSTTSPTASTHTGTLGATSLGSYGGQIAGGGDDSNTKLLLNFDRGGGTDIEDSSNTGGDGHKITASGHATIKASPFGDGKSAMFFDGVDGTNLTVSSFSGIGSGDFTFEFWFNCSDVDSDTNNSMIMDGRNSSNAGGFIFQIEKTNGQLFVYDGVNAGSYTNGRPIPTSSSTQITENSWHHVALVRSSGTLKLYMDGVEAGSASNSSDFSSDTLTFGRYRGGDGYNFPGYIDEVRVVVGTAVYTGDFDVPTSRLSKTQSAGTNISAITGTATKLLIHSNLEPQNPKDRTSEITVSNASVNAGALQNVVNGKSTNDTNGGVQLSGSNSLNFDLGSAKKISSYRFIQNTTNNHGTVSLKASNNSDFTSEVTVSGPGGSFGDDGTTDYFRGVTHTTAYRYYRLVTSGSWHSTPWITDISFHELPVDSSDSGHAITVGGSASHSTAHGGIAPAMTWPSSLKKTGSAGVYFDGTGDYLTIPNSADFNFVAGAWTIDFFMYPFAINSGVSGGIISSGHEGWANGEGRVWLNNDSGTYKLKIYTYGGEDRIINNVPIDTWTHVAISKDSSGNFRAWFNGVAKTFDAGSATDSREWAFCNSSNGTFIGTYKSNSSNHHDFKGYIDSFRVQKGVGYSSFAVPTEIYGAYRSQDVGTIQLNATAGTGGGALDYAELSGGTALSTYGLSLSSSGAITGTLTGLDDNSNSGGVIRIRARANADDNRLTTLGGSSFTGITQNDNTAPVLFNARRYIGTQGNRDISGFGFRPDFLWIKNRGVTNNHYLVDSVRGAGKRIQSNTTTTEGSQDLTQHSEFNSDGFGLGTSSSDVVNKTDNEYIAWGWKAGGAPSADGKKMVDGVESDLVSGTDYGVEQSYTTPFRNVRQSINTAGGFNITKFRLGDITNTLGEFAWFKHGLGSNPATDDPDFVMLKNMSQAQDWYVWHSGTGAWSSANGGGKLNLGDDFTGANVGQHFKKSASTGMGDALGDGKVWIDQRTIFAATVDEDFICYTWKATAGVSAFGTYEGTGGAHSITTGFRPRFVMVKNIDSNSMYWATIDSFRQSGDTITKQIYADLSNAEDTGTHKTMTLSNTGFGFTSASTYTAINESNSTHIYIAFA